MKRFLRHIALFVLSLLILAMVMEIEAESIPNSYTYKRAYIEQHGAEIKTLILGSSNAYDGLNPSVLPYAFNLANSSQTLEDDYRLMAKYIDSMDSLQTVIVGLGYHSLGAKYDVFEPFVMEKHVKNPTLDACPDEPWVINTKIILQSRVREGERDVYSINNTHWSPKGAEIVGEMLAGRISKK